MYNRWSVGQRTSPHNASVGGKRNYMSRCMKTNVENATDGRNRNNGMVNPGGGLYS